MARDTIVSTITTRLQTILSTATNPATGAPFNTDIGGNVTFGRVAEPSPHEMPGVNFVLLQENYFPGYGKNARQGVVQIEAFNVDRREDIGVVANEMLEDIDGALLYDTSELKMRLSGDVLEIRFNRGNPYLLAGQPPIAGLVAEYNIVYEP